MNTLSNKFRGLFSELRRRRVLNTFVLYVVSCWVILQVASVAFPIYDIANSYYHWLFVAFFALFPVVISVSWFYQLTPRGFVKIAPFVERRTLDNLSPRLDRRAAADQFHNREDARWSIFAETGPVEGLEYAITKSITLGRAIECEITLPRSYISRNHARIALEGGVLFVEDLGSSNGTLVNGVKTTGQQTLYHGDELRFKDVVFRVVENSSNLGSEALFNQTTFIDKVE
ncbi:MAG: FHA domain-containing protein [Porticoccaceae bacterium]